MIAIHSTSLRSLAELCATGLLVANLDAGV